MSEWTVDENFDFHEGERDSASPNGYTWEEFTAKTRPSCPECGASMFVAAVPAPSAGLKFYIPGRVRCPNGCQRPR